MSGRDELHPDERHGAFPFAFDEADSAGDAPESIPVDGSILWLPWKRWITGRGPKDETAVVFLQSILEELRVRFASGGAGAAGLLAGRFLRCPRTGRDWVRVERALPSLYLLDNGSGVRELERALEPLHERLSEDEAVVGWYRGRRSALPALTPEDLAFHARRMRPGRSPVVVEAAEASRPLAGVYVPGTEGACPPEAYHPFRELLPLDAVGADGTRFSRMHWTNYESDGRVVRPGAPEQGERPAADGAFVPSWQAVLQEALREEEVERSEPRKPRVEPSATPERALIEEAPAPEAPVASEAGPAEGIEEVEEEAIEAEEGAEPPRAEEPIPRTSPAAPWAEEPSPVEAVQEPTGAEGEPEEPSPVEAPAELTGAEEPDAVVGLGDRYAARRSARRRRRLAAVGGAMTAAAVLAIAVALGPWRPWAAAGTEGRESGREAARAAAVGATSVDAAAEETAAEERPAAGADEPALTASGTGDPGASFGRAADLYERRRAAFASGAIGCAELADAYRAADDAFLALALGRSGGTAEAGSARDAAYHAAVPRMAAVDAHFDGSGCPRP